MSFLFKKNSLTRHPTDLAGEEISVARCQVVFKDSIPKCCLSAHLKCLRVSSLVLPYVFFISGKGKVISSVPGMSEISLSFMNN